MAQLDRATVCGTVGRRFESSWAHHITGEVAERSKAVDSKSAVPYGYRGFESHPLLSPHGEGQRDAGPRMLNVVCGPMTLGVIQGVKVTTGRCPAPPCKGGWGDSSLAPHSIFINRRGGRVVEGARLESVCRLIPYRGFESLPLRHSPHGEEILAQR